MEIECYNEQDFIRDYHNKYVEAYTLADNMGINLEKFSFCQYTVDGIYEHLVYESIIREDTTFNIEWIDGKLESVEVTQD